MLSFNKTPQEETVEVSIRVSKKSITLIRLPIGYSNGRYILGYNGDTITLTPSHNGLKAYLNGNYANFQIGKNDKRIKSLPKHYTGRMARIKATVDSSGIFRLQNPAEILNNAQVLEEPTLNNEIEFTASNCIAILNSTDGIELEIVDGVLHGYISTRTRL